MTTKTLRGPGLTIALDSTQVFPSDPGDGTPAMVTSGRYSASYHCADNEGELTDSRGETLLLTEAQRSWLSRQEDAVGDFIEAEEKRQIASMR